MVAAASPLLSLLPRMPINNNQMKIINRRAPNPLKTVLPLLSLALCPISCPHPLIFHFLRANAMHDYFIIKTGSMNIVGILSTHMNTGLELGFGTLKYWRT